MKKKEKEELPKLPRGQGSFKYQTKNGLICYTKRINNKYISVYAKTVNECFSKMKTKEKEIEEKAKQMHPIDNGAQVLLQEAIYTWLFTYKKPVMKGRAFDTIEGTYNNQLKDTFLGRTLIEQVESDDIQRFLNNLIENKSLSTTKKTFSLLKQFFEYYYAKDINNNPMNLVRLPKKQVIYDVSNVVDNEEMVVLSDSEIERLSEELSKPYQEGKVGYSYGHMLLFTLWSFMRIGEVIALQYKDIDFETKTLKVYKAYGKERDRSEGAKNKYKWVLTTAKTKSGRRTLYLYEKAWDNLMLHIQEHYPNAKPDTFIFFTKQGNPMPDQFLNNMLSKALERAGITKKITIHGLRHTGISFFLRHGVSDEVISKQAGHSDIATTHKVYYTVIEEQQRSAFNNLDKN